MLSIIIPAWNEAEVIPSTIRSALAQTEPRELLLVDGGSTDLTREVACHSGLRVIVSPIRQRAAQMNLGAAQAKGTVFLFLHADTLLPPQAAESIAAALENPRVVGGAFQRHFATSSLFLRTTFLLTLLRNRTLGWHLGDQAIFVRRTLFEQLGGFAPFDRFEDLEFSRRMGRLGKVVTLEPPVLTSSRRFQRLGPIRQTARDFFLTMRYLVRKQSAVVLQSQPAPAPVTRDAPEQPF